MKKILLAEDDRISRVMLQAVLLKWGYQVESAQNGEEALLKLSDPNGPSLAILDWMMPVVDGLEVCRRIRETPGIRHVHLILLTSKSKGSDAASALSVGADDHIAKPYDLIELQARIELGFRRIRWARDCSMGHLRPQQIQGLLEVNRLAMLHAMRPKTESKPRESSSSLRETLEGVDRCMADGLHTSIGLNEGSTGCFIPLGREVLEQLLANLYAHWKAAMPSGGNVDISWHTGPDRVRITCRDDGPSVSDVQILSGAPPLSESGRLSTGIGLLFSKALAESCGGSLAWTHPLEGTGLCLEIELPIVPGSAQPA